MTYSFHPAAQSEFEQAALYYFEKNLSLASAFYNEVAFAIEGIVENPFLYRGLMKTCVVVSQNAFHTLFSIQSKITIF